MQKIILIGFAGKDPEERFTSGGKKVTSFPVAVSFNKQGEKFTVWYKVVCWGEQSSHILPHIKKGSCVTVTGDLLPPKTYQNKNGDISIDMTVTCQSIDFVPKLNQEKPQQKEEDPSVFDFGDTQ